MARQVQLFYSLCDKTKVFYLAAVNKYAFTQVEMVLVNPNAGLKFGSLTSEHKPIKREF